MSEKALTAIVALCTQKAVSVEVVKQVPVIQEKEVIR